MFTACLCRSNALMVVRDDLKHVWSSELIRNLFNRSKTNLCLGVPVI